MFIVDYTEEILNLKNYGRSQKLYEKGVAAMIGGGVQRFPKAGDSRTIPAGLGDDIVNVRNVEPAAGHQVDTRR